MTDFRALCAELVEALNTNDYYEERSDEMAYSGLLSRARAALEAQPEPQGPTGRPKPPSLKEQAHDAYWVLPLRP